MLTIIPVNRTTKGIHSGPNTHHQDQSITPVNFKTMNINVKTLKNPMPFEFCNTLTLILFHPLFVKQH